MNARFWVWWNDGWVKLTLELNSVVHLYESHETDEGYSFVDELYEHDGDEVVCRCVSGGQDCDGPIEHHSVSAVRLNDLEVCSEPQSPPWRQVKAWQRDAYAEAMGY